MTSVVSLADVRSSARSVIAAEGSTVPQAPTDEVDQELLLLGGADVAWPAVTYQPATHSAKPLPSAVIVTPGSPFDGVTESEVSLEGGASNASGGSGKVSGGTSCSATSMNFFQICAGNVPPVTWMP